MTQEQLQSMLREGTVSFTFKKKDGTIRDAKGTLNLDVIKSADQKAYDDLVDTNKTRHRNVADDVVTYFDLDKNGWRSFRWSQFIDLK